MDLRQIHGAIGLLRADEEIIVDVDAGVVLKPNHSGTAGVNEDYPQRYCQR